METVPTSVPYRAEYAKTGRSSCKERNCKNPIPAKELRFAIMVTSRFHDGKDTHWYHSDCFFKKAKPASANLIEGIDNLRWEDQVAIRKRFEGASEPDTPTANGSKNKKKKKGATSTISAASTNGTTKRKSVAAYDDFGVENAKTGRSACVACERQIANKEIRVWKLDNSPDTLATLGGVPVPRHHHLHCFALVRSQIGFLGQASELPGFKKLSAADQKIVKTEFDTVVEEPKSTHKVDGEPLAKKLKAEEKGATKNEELMMKQNKTMFKLRDFLNDKLTKKEMKRNQVAELLLENNQDYSGATFDQKFDLLCDVMVFGALVPCAQCSGGQYVFKSGVGYECTGSISGFTKCLNVKLDPPRTSFVIPKDHEKALEGYTFDKVGTRVLAIRSKTEDDKRGGFVKVSTLAGWKIFLSPGMSAAMVKRLNTLASNFEAEIVSEMDPSVNVVLATQSEAKKSSKEMLEAQKHDIPVVKRDFLESFTVGDNLVERMKKFLVSGWTVIDSIPARVEAIKSVSKVVHAEEGRGRGRKRPMDKKLEIENKNLRLKMKDGNVVDPECEVADHTHVYKEGKTVYSVVLKKTDVDMNLNSFYKIQLLEHDGRKDDYYVFRSWGRLGTKQGGTKLEGNLDLDEAKEIFERQFSEKTGNEFGAPFVKKPDGYMLLDVAYQQPPEKKMEVSEESKLPLAVQNLICLIFDVKRMLSTLVEFEIDTAKMPLGKISRDQILRAFSLLNNLMESLQKPNMENSQRLIVDFSNQFFSLVPHNVGLSAVPVLNSKDMVRDKLVMLEQLLEIELAYEMIHTPGGSNSNAVDDNYKRLNAAITPLEKNSADFEIIKTYLDNTHASTHSQYALKIQHVYKVNRNGEQERFTNFSNLPNHKLLWHGSRTTNFAGILSQGLRIAPPEAPVTGYMFGKGIYFADMVSKSANYCYPSMDSTSGLLLLCQVALGESKRYTSAKDTLLKAPKGYQSVLGVGETHPDPKTFTTLEKSINVPYGRPTPTGVKTDLLYNEYIVYDVAQVQLRYILNVEFEFGRKK